MQNVDFRLSDIITQEDWDDDLYTVLNRTIKVRCDCCGIVGNVFVNSHCEFRSNLKWSIFANGDIVYCPKCSEVKHGDDIGA